jgi:hypothetical protein
MRFVFYNLDRRKKLCVLDDGYFNGVLQQPFRMLPEQMQIGQGAGSERKIASHGFWKVRS